MAMELFDATASRVASASARISRTRLRAAGILWLATCCAFQGPAGSTMLSRPDEHCSRLEDLIRVIFGQELGAQEATSTKESYRSGFWEFFS